MEKRKFLIKEIERLINPKPNIPEQAVFRSIDGGLYKVASLSGWDYSKYPLMTKSECLSNVKAKRRIYVNRKIKLI